jgi:hypothetical protein
MHGSIGLSIYFSPESPHNSAVPYPNELPYRVNHALLKAAADSLNIVKDRLDAKNIIIATDQIFLKK